MLFGGNYHPPFTKSSELEEHLIDSGSPCRLWFDLVFRDEESGPRE
jgi:hypothetical protein